MKKDHYNETYGQNASKLWEGELIPMLDWHISECMVTTIIINNGIKELTCGYQNCNTSQRKEISLP
jgi:hypothetical protein